MLPLLVGLLACGGYPVEDFNVDIAASTCTLYQQCEYLDVFGFDSLDACTTTVQQSYEGVACPAYDKDLAEQCVQGVDAMSCDDLYANTWPQACADRCGATGDGTLGGSDSGS